MLSIESMRRMALAALISMFLAYPAAAGAKDAINTNWRKVAVKGYDPVAYFTLGEAVKGKKEFEFNWKGAKWWFSTQAHRDLFAANPEKYAPQYGGY